MGTVAAHLKRALQANMKEKHELGIGASIVGWLWLITALIVIVALLKIGGVSKTLDIAHITFAFLTTGTGVVAGIATGLRYRWGARVLLVLSWIGVVYFLSMGLAGSFVWVLSRLNPLIGVIPFALMALPAYLFAAYVITLSLALQSNARSPNKQPNLSR